MQELFPAFLKVAAGKSTEGFAHDIVSTRLIKPGYTSQKLQLRQAAEQRLDERLNRHQCAIEGPRVTPGFEIMSCRKVIRGNHSGLILLITEANDRFGFALGIGPSQVNR